MKKFDIYLVTDSTLSRNGTINDVTNAIRGGCKIIQYREKNKSIDDAISEAKKIREICKDTLFIINDRVDVALAINADGVHIGQDDISYEKARETLGEKIIGITVHNENEAIEAEKKGADYVGLGPIFRTDTKNDAGESCGLEMIKKVKNVIHIPIVAIGGISLDNVSAVIEAGADSAAVVSAIVCSNDVFEETKKFVKIIDRVNKELNL